MVCSAMITYRLCPASFVEANLAWRALAGETDQQVPSEEAQEQVDTGSQGQLQEESTDNGQEPAEPPQAAEEGPEVPPPVDDDTEENIKPEGAESPGTQSDGIPLEAPVWAPDQQQPAEPSYQTESNEAGAPEQPPLQLLDPVEDSKPAPLSSQSEAGIRCILSQNPPALLPVST